MSPARPLLPLVFVLLLAGCFGGVFQAEASSPLVLSSFAYDGSGGRDVEGKLKVTLYDGRDTGSIVATYRDAVDTFELRWSEFAPREAWQGGGIVTDIDLFGATGNGPPILPQLRAYVAAWGRVEYRLDDVLQPDPTNLASTWNATFFIVQGAYRDNETRRITGPQGSDFDPSSPPGAPASLIGATAVILLETSRGDLYRVVEYRDVKIVSR